ncbi:hypothetical protein QOT17_016885 [Balamuthia mandrillaris]
MKERVKEYLALTTAIGIPLFGGLLSLTLTSKSVRNWFRRLHKPRYTPFPPRWATAPSLALLYSSLGYASFLVWRAAGRSSSSSFSVAALPLLSLPSSTSLPSLPLPSPNHSAAPFNLFTTLGCYATHLLLSWAWYPLFFRWHRLGWALADSALLWLNLVVCMREFYRARPLAAAVMTPWLLWVSYLTVANLNFWRLNRSQRMVGEKSWRLIDDVDDEEDEEEEEEEGVDVDVEEEEGDVR